MWGRYRGVEAEIIKLSGISGEASQKGVSDLIWSSGLKEKDKNIPNRGIWVGWFPTKMEG